MTVVLVGESASGKSSLAKLLSDRKPSFSRVVTYTTRPMRGGEQNHVDYHFISDEEFMKLKNDGFFVEFNQYRNWNYGTSIDLHSANNQVIVLTPAGARALLRKTQHDESVRKQIKIVYLSVDRRSRLLKCLERGDDIEEAYRRNLSDVGQFDAFDTEADYILENENYQWSVSILCDQLIDYIDRERKNV